MKSINTIITLLSIFSFAGLVLTVFGNFQVDTETREAFTYLGTGTFSLTGVVLVETIRRRNEMHKISIRKELPVHKWF